MEQCSYCGRENEGDKEHCSGCGNPLSTNVEAAEPKQKSKAIAAILALIFGPLGLLYLGLEGLVVILLLLGIAFFVSPLLLGIKSGASIAFFGRVACAIYAVNAVEKKAGTTNAKSKAIEMLNEAARLETVDRDGALAKYEEIIGLFPDSAASGEAERAVQTLKKATVASREE